MRFNTSGSGRLPGPEAHCALRWLSAAADRFYLPL